MFGLVVFLFLIIPMGGNRWGFDGNFMSVGLLIFIMYIFGRSEGSHDDLATQASVWLHMVGFSAIRFGTVCFSTSYANLR
jgi:hypothetical protein